jgi:2-keto-4-pentenoate hydratase
MRPVAEALLANRPSPPIAGMTSLDDGLCAQVSLVSVLMPHWGRIVGYKVGLTSAPVQQRFGVNQPLRGVMLESSISLRDGAEVPARFGAVPIIESDFLVRVRDAGINTAGRDHVAILRHLDAVIPYIELPDLVLTGGFDGPNLLAINVGARLGVVGTPIPVEATQAFADRLANMTVTMVDDRGQERARAPGTAALGHPLNVVAFLVEDLARDGLRLEAGHVISVAGYSPTLPLEAGRTYTVRYEGLQDAPVSVSVRTR